MAQKFRNSYNSEEFGTLALLDFLPFVIAKPQRPLSSKSDHSERNERHFVDDRQHLYITQLFQFSEIYHFTFSPQFVNPSPFRQFLSYTLHLQDYGPSSMSNQGCHFKKGQIAKQARTGFPKWCAESAPPPLGSQGKKYPMASRVKVPITDRVQN